MASVKQTTKGVVAVKQRILHKIVFLRASNERSQRFDNHRAEKEKCFNVKALVGAFNQDKALVGAFSVITNLRLKLYFIVHMNGAGAEC